MWDVNYNAILEDVKKINEDASTLIDLLQKDYEADENDWCKMLRIRERLFYFQYFIFLRADWYDLSYKMESDKDRFEVQKIAQCHLKRFEEEVELMIFTGRNWKFKDYRCINFQKRLEELFVNIQEAFEKGKE